MKKSMTNVDVLAWITETAERLVGARIVNIYMPRSDLYVFKIRLRDGEVTNLVIEPGRRIHLSSIHVRGTGEVPGKLRNLRSLIRNCIIECVEQLDLERVIIFKIKCGNVEYRMIAELLPRGILCILDQDKRIIFTSEALSMKDRDIRPGIVYKPPPSIDILNTSLDELVKLAMKGKDIVRGLVRGWGLPGEVSEEVLARANIDKKRKPDEISLMEYQKILNALKSLLNEVRYSREYYGLLKDGKLVYFYPFKPSIVIDGDLIRYDSFNKLLDEYFTQIEAELRKEIIATEISKDIKRLESTIKALEFSISELSKELEILKTKEAIFSEKFIEVDEVLNCVRSTIKSKGWDYVSECRGVTKFYKDKGIVIVKVDDTELELDVTKTTVENYNSYRSRISDIMRSIKKAEEQLKEFRSKIEELRRASEVKIETEVSKAMRRREWYERFHWLITSSGFLVIGGRNAEQNEAIIRRYLRPQDILLHAEIHGASAVVIKAEGREVDDKSLKEAAVLAAAYSKAWRLGLGAVDVFWVRGDQVSLSPPAGEYLPHGAFMVYGKKNFIRNVPLQIAIGIEFTERGPRVIVGPEELVASRTNLYAVLVPGELEPRKVAEIIIEKFISKAEDRASIVKSIDIDEITERIPGRSRILKLDC